MTVAEKNQARRDRISEIIATCEDEERDLDDDEKAECDRLVEACKADVAREKFSDQMAAKFGGQFEKGIKQMQSQTGTINGDNKMFQQHSDYQRDGIVCVAQGQSVADAIGVKPPVAFGVGECIKAMIVGGNNKKVCPEIRAALSTSNNTSGGFLVPNELSTTLIDYARNKTAVMKAGASVFMMESSELTLAKIASDPTISCKAENEAFVATTIAFGASTLDARTTGCLIECSRELAEDAPNFAQQVETTLARALATAVDQYVLCGTGSAQPTGLSIRPLIDDTGTTSVGAIAWEDFITATTAVRARNHEPNAIILSPTIHSDAMALTSGDGSNAAKLWLNAPPHLAGITMLETANCTDGYAFVADWSKLAIGIRTGVLVEASTQAGDAFAKHQVHFKITYRWDYVPLDVSAFHRLSGITT